MLKRGWFFLFSFSLFTICLMYQRPSYAMLGESKDSIADDAAAVRATQQTQEDKSKYVIHKIHTTHGMIREYIIPSDDIIFGIAWDGLIHPDLNQLLGSYADEYEDALKQNPHKHGHRSHHSIQTDDLVVEKWGHMRSMHGRAYDPTLLPTGVSPHEIQ